jgi:septal ring factor EnvC (AmiA/AmiB activator)
MTTSAQPDKFISLAPIGALGRKLMICMGTALLVSACGATQMQRNSVDASAVQDFKDSSISANDASLIVDCLLPGKIKKLGSSFTYIAPRRPLKATSLECEIRGGEYVAYDRANYQTALNVWLPLAKEGDKNAQTYIGAIYEKGLGVAPDYTKAVHWYQQAADQGYARAQFSLAYLYEMGLGIGKDAQKAFSLYSQASGLGKSSLVVARLKSDKKELARLEEATQAEQALLQKIEQEVVGKNHELSQVSHELKAARKSFASKKKLLAELEEETQTAQAERTNLASRIEVEKYRLADLKSEIDQKRGMVAQVEGTLTQQKQVGERKNAELAALINGISERQNTLQAQYDRLIVAKNSAEHKLQNASQAQEAQKITTQITTLNKDLVLKQKELTNSDTRLNAQKRLAKQKSQELLTLLAKVEGRKQALRADLAKLERTHADVRQRKQQINEEQRRLTGDWKENRDRLKSELAKQESIIAQLEDKEQDNREKVAQLNRKKNTKKLALLAPRIQLIDPLVPRFRSAINNIPVIHVRAGLAERELVGKILSDNDLLLATLNHKKLNVSEQGVFKEVVEITDNGALVEIVAVDSAGQRSAAKFVLAKQQASASQTRSLSGNDRVERPVQRPKPTDIDFGNYYALLIGNNEYSNFPDLKTPITDIESIAQTLNSKYGFKETITLKNATRYDIITSLNKLRNKLTDKDNLLVYYAGHGELDKINMTGQWLPVDAEADNTANWISNSALTELINTMSAKHIMVVADSCYSGIMTRSALANIESGKSVDARTTWLRKMVVKRSRTVLTSGGVAPVLDEGGEEHSVFARAFLDALRSNNNILEGQQLYHQVSAAVAMAAERFRVDQVPEYAPIRHAGHESGDFFLVPAS